MKLVDISFIIPAGSHMWKESMHEPVEIFLTFPLLKHSPYRVKNEVERVHEFTAGIPWMQRKYWDKGRIDMRKFWRESWDKRRGVPERLAW